MTDVAGAVLSRLVGPVAAFNVLILISFPLSAASAFALARYLGVGPPGALLAALAYAFSPFHIAQAAYHVHIAQTQWLPLYLLSLLRWIDGRGRGVVVAATAACTRRTAWLVDALDPRPLVIAVGHWRWAALPGWP